MITSALYFYMDSNNEFLEIPELMIEFAKLHVTEALKQASEKAECDDVGIVENSILNSYPLDNIK